MFLKLSNLNSNLALTLGYLNPALNNSALDNTLGHQNSSKTNGNEAIKYGWRLHDTSGRFCHEFPVFKILNMILLFIFWWKTKVEIKKKNKLSRVTRKTPKECFQINFVSFNSLLVVTGDREVKKTQHKLIHNTLFLCVMSTFTLC